MIIIIVIDGMSRACPVRFQIYTAIRNRNRFARGPYGALSTTDRTQITSVASALIQSKQRPRDDDATRDHRDLSP
jgi:hypothetical protein